MHSMMWFAGGSRPDGEKASSNILILGAVVPKGVFAETVFPVIYLTMLFSWGMM